MTILALLLLVDAAAHAYVIYRFGTNENMPFLIFAVIDLALAIAVFFAVPYALWATLVLSVVGILGLTVTFNKPQREKTLDYIIWVLDAAVILVAIYLPVLCRGQRRTRSLTAAGTPGALRRRYASGAFGATERPSLAYRHCSHRHTRPMMGRMMSLQKMIPRALPGAKLCAVTIW